VLGGTVAANSSTDAVAAVVAILIAGAAMLGSMYGLRHAFTYALENLRLDIRILGFTVRRLHFSDIDHVEVIPFDALVPFSRSFRWDVFFSWKYSGYESRVIAITRRTGLVKRIIVSPRDPEQFSNLLRAASLGATGATCQE
jgi:hypothetical protein